MKCIRQRLIFILACLTFCLTLDLALGFTLLPWLNLYCKSANWPRLLVRTLTRFAKGKTRLAEGQNVRHFLDARLKELDVRLAHLSRVI
jgi:hypothetical protein